MNALMSLVNSLSATSASSGGNNTNLGKYYLAIQGLSGLSTLAAGIAGIGATQNEADNLNQQAEIALQEAQQAAMQQRREVINFRETQAQAYNNSGVTLEGSPLLVLSDTIRKGNQEINSIQKRGQALAKLYRANAAQTKRSGIFNAVSSGLQAASGLGSAYVLGQRLGILGNASTAGSSVPGNPAPVMYNSKGPV